MKYLVSLVGLLLLISSAALSQNRKFSFQGYIEVDGTPVTGGHAIIFTLWDNLEDGSSGWTETHANVPFVNGVFNVMLGDLVSLEDVDFIEYRYMGIRVDGQLIAPRTEVTSAPSALTVATPLSLSNTWSAGHTLKVLNLATSGPSFGIIGKSSSTSGIGVYGESTPTGTSLGHGVAGVSKASDGNSAGVYGSGPLGVWGASIYGPAVFGKTSATNGAGVGVTGETNSPFGSGVRGMTAGPTGPSRGVWGQTNSDEGYAGYFVGGVAVYARAVDNSTPDVILAGNDNTSDNGWISSDTDYGSSDLIITSNDDINIQLDRNNDEDGILYISANGTTTSIFSVEEDGTVRVNGSLVHASDRNLKEGFEAVDPQEILKGVAEMPVTKWRYKGRDETHVGPMAQDFRATFGLGEDDTGIATVDADGVALAAIQALYEIVMRQQAEIETLKRTLSESR